MPANNKIVFGNNVLIDLTGDTAIESDVAQGKIFHKADGTQAVGTASGAATVVVTEETDAGGGIIKHITADVLSLQAKTATPTESQQVVTPDSGYNGLSRVTISAVDSNYVGSGIDRRTSSDLTVSGATVTAPAGYYSAQVSASVASGGAGTPVARTSPVESNSITIVPSVTNTTGYITGSTINGTPVTVSASDLVSGTLTITGNGTRDVTNYASVNVNIDYITYYTGSSNPSASTGSDGDIYLKVAN